MKIVKKILTNIVHAIYGVFYSPKVYYYEMEKGKYVEIKM